VNSVIFLDFIRGIAFCASFMLLGSPLCEFCDFFLALFVIYVIFSQLNL